jgi:hypothetical protein
MSNDPKAPAAGRRSLGKASELTGLALISVVLATVAATFAYVGGWFTLIVRNGLFKRMAPWNIRRQGTASTD